jgi:hypothetical protein
MDVDANRELAVELGIRSVPTVKTFNMGSVATTKARAALATKLGKPEGSISTSTAYTKMYNLADGRYECTATVKIN